MIHLIINTGNKEQKVVACTEDATKASHWQELFEIQGEDVTVALLDKDQQEILLALIEKVSK